MRIHYTHFFSRWHFRSQKMTVPKLADDIFAFIGHSLSGYWCLLQRKQMTSSMHYFIYNSTTCWQSLCTKTTEAHALFQVSHGKMNEKNTWHENNIYSVLSGVIVTGCRWKNASKCHNIYTHNQIKYEICAKMPLSVELLRDDTGAVDDLKFIAI